MNAVDDLFQHFPVNCIFLISKVNYVFTTTISFLDVFYNNVLLHMSLPIIHKHILRII